MKGLFIPRIIYQFLVFVLAGTAALPAAHADPVIAHYVQGSYHGFLELRAQDGRVVAAGDSTCVVRGDTVEVETVFRFKDGSIDDEKTAFTQHRTFQMISDHHLQKGPFFPHPMDVLIDARSGTVTVRSIGKDGKQEVSTDHLTLPSDLSNGIVPQVIENMGKGATQTTVSMVVMAPKPRVVKLVISAVGEDNYSLLGDVRKASHYHIKIDLGGVVAVIAPLIGKAPPDIEMWLIGGAAPTFAKTVGPLFADGPPMTIQLASPSWEKK